MKKQPRQARFQRNRRKHRSWLKQMNKKGIRMNEQVNQVATENDETVTPGKELTERKVNILRDLRGEGQETPAEGPAQV